MSDGHNPVAYALRRLFDDSHASTVSGEEAAIALRVLASSGLGYSLSQSRSDGVLESLAACALASRQALDYDSRNPVPRWRLVAEHLEANGRFPREDIEGISRRVAQVLDGLDAERAVPREGGLSALARRDGWHCRSCRFPFKGPAPSVLTSDSYKPHHLDDGLGEPEIDHRIPISLSGTNSFSNYQLLCRACNAAKRVLVAFSPDVEIRYASAVVAETPRMHRFKMAYWAFREYRSTCFRCQDSHSRELTVRPVVADASYMRANLAVYCYQCVDG